MEVQIKIVGGSCSVSALFIQALRGVRAIEGLTPEQAARTKDMVAAAFAQGYDECQHDVRRNIHRTASDYNGEDLKPQVAAEKP